MRQDTKSYLQLPVFPKHLYSNSATMSSDEINHRRILLIPGSGMGHLINFIRLAEALSSRRISTSILAFRPTVSAAESRLLSSLRTSLVLDFPLSPLDPSLFPPFTDPFCLQMEALRRSAHLLPTLISTHSPPFSSVIIDITMASASLPVRAAAKIPCFLLFPSCASMLALCSAFPLLPQPIRTDVNIADGILKIPYFSLPPPLRDPNHLFTTVFAESGRALTQANGILINTFLALEPEILAELNAGRVLPGLPPVIAIGPLSPARNQPSSPSQATRWLDEQTEKSVFYVCFGNRTAMSRVQITELGAGLEMSGCRFLWVLKSTIVDREEVEIGELLGEEFVRRVGERGLVTSEWVEQEVVLGHRAVGGFLSHCGWNSVLEAAEAGVKMLAWPGIGDHMVNAAVVARSGLGIWPENWVWEPEEGVVTAEEISVKVREVMEDERVAAAAAKVWAEAAAAVEEGGSSDQSFCCWLKKL